MRPPELYLQPGAPDPVLPNDVVLRLVRRHIPIATSVTAVDETGGEARVYVIDDTVILKTQRPQQLRARTSLAKEVLFLGQLDGQAGIAVPYVHGYGREGSVEYICMTRISGVAVAYVELTALQRRAALLELGRMLRRIHEVSQEAFAASGLMPGDHTRDDLVARVRLQLDLARSALASSAQEWPLPLSLAGVSERLLSALPSDTPIAALHSNPGPPHTFVNPATGTLAGLIDFGDAFTSHPAFDLGRWPSLDDRRLLLEGYEAGTTLSGDWLRMWQIVMALTEIAQIVTRPASRQIAAANLTTLLSDL